MESRIPAVGKRVPISGVTCRCSKTWSRLSTQTWWTKFPKIVETRCWDAGSGGSTKPVGDFVFSRRVVVVWWFDGLMVWCWVVVGVHCAAPVSPHEHQARFGGVAWGHWLWPHDTDVFISVMLLVFQFRSHQHPKWDIFTATGGIMEGAPRAQKRRWSELRRRTSPISRASTHSTPSTGVNCIQVRKMGREIGWWRNPELDFPLNSQSVGNTQFKNRVACCWEQLHKYLCMPNRSKLV